MPKVGILALQGAVAEHADALRELDATVVELRSPEHLAGVDAVVLPGGESTTMSLLLESVRTVRAAPRTSRATGCRRWARARE